MKEPTHLTIIKSSAGQSPANRRSSIASQFWLAAVRTRCVIGRNLVITTLETDEMWRAILIATLVMAAHRISPAMAEEADSTCDVESIGQIDLSLSSESDLVIASGNKCEARTINIVIQTHDGIKIFETQIPHRDLRTSGLTREEVFTRRVQRLVGGYRRTLPSLDQIETDYFLYVELEEYERLRRSNTPAYSFPEGYYLDTIYIVYDPNIGEVVTVINIGGT